MAFEDNGTDYNKIARFLSAKEGREETMDECVDEVIEKMDDVL